MNPQTSIPPVAYLTVPAFCKAHGFKEHAVRRAVNAGLLPVYKPFGARQYLRVDEALAFIAVCRKGGAQ